MRDSILYFDEIGLQDVVRVGNKNAALGEIYQQLSHKGVLVPDGFVISTKVYQEFLNQNNLKRKITDIIKGLNTSDFSNLSEIGKTVRSTLQKSIFPYYTQVLILAAYNELLERVDSDGHVIVRCSAIANGVPKINFAKQLDCYLNIKGEDALLEACKNCFISLYTDKAIKYCALRRIKPTDITFSIGVQQMIRPSKKSASLRFNLSKQETETIDRWSALIDQHFQVPMTIEWVKDEVDGKLYVSQAYSKTQNMVSPPAKFYEAIGHISYAIAAADGKVRTSELETLKKIILEDWSPNEHTTDSSSQIQIAFEQLMKKDVASDQAISNFKLYLESHKELFTPPIKSLIWKTVNSIAEAVAGKNKSELILLSKLNTLLS